MVSQPLHEGAYNSVGEADMEISCCCAGPQANAPGEWKKPWEYGEEVFPSDQGSGSPPTLSHTVLHHVCVLGGGGGAVYKKHNVGLPWWCSG